MMFPQQAMTWDYLESGMVESQVEVLKSDNVARAVVRDKHLTEDPEFVGSGQSLWGTVSAAIFGAPPLEVRS
jgi:polysaccharide biosynthesis transport protein